MVGDLFRVQGVWVVGGMADGRYSLGGGTFDL